MLLSDRTISFDNAVGIMRTSNGDSDLDFYTPLGSDAYSVAKTASGGGELISHDYLHTGLAWGFKHYHHILHIPSNSGSGQYPAHGYYGEILFGF